MTENQIATKILYCALEVHKAVGPGLLENAYQECLYYKLVKEGLDVYKEKPMPLIFEEVRMECGYRIDLLVENKVVIELKSVEALNGSPFSSNSKLSKTRKVQTGFTHQLQ